jgi:hypothetical protein
MHLYALTTLGRVTHRLDLYHGPQPMPIAVLKIRNHSNNATMGLSLQRKNMDKSVNLRFYFSMTHHHMSRDTVMAREFNVDSWSVVDGISKSIVPEKNANYRCLMKSIVTP